jgi:hypothetical protein
MISVTSMWVHRACHTGSGMFVRLTRMLIGILMGVSVIHVVLVLRSRESVFLRCYCGRALPSYMKVMGFGPGM